MYSRALAGTALAYALLHHLGLLPDGLGVGPEGTQWVDWIDLLVPWLVLVPAALCVWSAGSPSAGPASPGVWALFGAGALAYASGHGIHLAANSVGNVAPGETAHLWDEVVGHYLWFAGVVLVAAALAMTMRGRPRPAKVGPAAAACALAVGVGITWATNAIGGGTVVFSAVAGLAACWAGWSWRRELGVVWLVVGGSAVAWLAVAAAVGAAG